MFPEFMIVLAILGDGGPGPVNFEQQLASAFASGDMHSFDRLSASDAPLHAAEWQSVRDFLDTYDSITIESYVLRQPAAGDPILEIEGHGLVRNTRRNRRTFRHRWVVRRAPELLVESEAQHLARRLLDASTATVRQSIVEGHGGVSLSEVARLLGEYPVDGRQRLKEAGQSLLDHSARTGDRLVETLALIAVARASDGSEALAHAASARMLASMQGDPDLMALAVAAQAGVTDDPVPRTHLFDELICRIDDVIDPGPALAAGFREAETQYDNFDVARTHHLYETLLQYSRRFGRPRDVARGLYGQSRVAAVLGRRDRASELASEVQSLAHAVGERHTEARALAMRAVMMGYGSPQSAATFEDALATAPPSSTSLLAFIHSRLAHLYSISKPEDGERHLALALRASRTTADWTGVYHWAMLARRNQGRWGEAIEMGRKGVLAGKNSLWVVWAIKGALADLLIECGGVEEATELLRESLELVEARRRAVPVSAVDRAREYGTRLNPYHLLESALLDLGRGEEALTVAERSRARVLSDGLSGQRWHASLEARDRDNLDGLSRTINRLNRDVMSARGPVEASSRQLTAARRDLQTVMADLAIRYPQTPPSSTLNTVESVIVPPETIAVEYSVRQKSTSVYVLRPGFPVVAKNINASAAALDEHVRQLQEQIERRDGAFTAHARELYDLLIEPVAALIGDARQMTILPDGTLWGLPFHALPSATGQFLGDRVVISYAPSLATFEKARYRSPSTANGSLLAFGDPLVAGAGAKKAELRGLDLGPLPDAAAEVHAVGRLYKTRERAVFVGRDAGESTFKREAPHYRVLHLATHGLIDEQNPLFSSLLMAAGPDGDQDVLLELREIQELDLSGTDLAVLSACSTARGEVTHGEGVLGMSWAFQMAGCPTTVVSQWQTDSKSSAELMIEFHRQLQRGLSPAESLQKASLKLRVNPRYADPIYWAPFVVIGAN